MALVLTSNDNYDISLSLPHKYLLLLVTCMSFNVGTPALVYRTVDIAKAWALSVASSERRRASCERLLVQ